MSSTPHLLKISKKKPVLATLPAVRPIVDIFFLVAVVSGLIGMVVIGGYLWVVLSGAVPAGGAYVVMREFHISVQLYLFFGVAICGFIIQAAPRVLNIGQPISRRFTYGILSAPCAGVFLKALGFSAIITAVLMALAPFTTCIFLIVRQKRRAFRPHSLFIIVALLSLSGSVVSNTADPRTAFLVFWLAVGGALLGTSHIFIANLLGGRQLGPKTLYGCLGAFVLSAALIALDQPSGGIGVGLLLVTFYIFRTRLFNTSSGPALVRIGFKLSYVWCLFGWVLLGLDYVGWDQALHILATGWGVTILFVLSLHITGFISSFTGNDRAFNVAALIIWQAIPFSRGLLPLHSSLVAALGIGSALVLMTVWLISLWNRRYYHKRSES